ncbi:MAG: right-handed parallel beta-helix repeat-containing protein [Bacteroidales bacterium]|nr:right-handed parallel beta-helix repeat-containing protein [Bacteroidales bacterium]
MMKIIHVVLSSMVFYVFSAGMIAQPYYVALNGNNDYDGSETKPFETIEKAVSVVKAGETIYVRGGTYELLATITIGISGTTDSMISLHAYHGERAVLDFSGQELGGSNRGIKLTGSYWHIKGIDITGAGDNGMKIEGGSNNIIENCAFYRNRDSGMQLDNGASNNKVINCDSYYNADPADYGDADGFAPKLSVGSGNHFYGCRAWKNCDDGWDGYLRGADDVSNSAENCWSFENGYLENGTDPGPQANGNGFKMGGSDDKTLRHNFTLKNCLAFKNKVKGFDQNNNKGSMILYNCTGHNNLTANFRMTQELAAGKVLIVKNCVDLGGSAEIATFAQQEKNSWMSPFVVTGEDFLSIDDISAYGPRKEDGSLPDIAYMHLAPGSDLIDAGVDVGLPFAGSLPDLGCFEADITAIHDRTILTGVVCYPNPIRSTGFLSLNLPEGGHCVMRLYDVSGRFVRTLPDINVKAGEQQISFDVGDLQDGFYFLRMTLDNTPVFVIRLFKQSEF